MTTRTGGHSFRLSKKSRQGIHDVTFLLY